VRRGEWDLPGVLDRCARLEARLHDLASASPLPE
jgi:hypothetical protein